MRCSFTVAIYEQDHAFKQRIHTIASIYKYWNLTIFWGPSSVQKLNCTDPGKEFTSTDTPHSYGRSSSWGGRLEIENITLVKTRFLSHFWIKTHVEITFVMLNRNYNQKKNNHEQGIFHIPIQLVQSSFTICKIGGKFR